ncbi:ABC-type dipeptide/oligopeptide/nickel transport system permease component [Streptacidiphilus sp. MAP12-20]|uniref:hypothetical protein n=1 Tax=Streptacidiphilus sp. MAP12-20 TaxID=3156299 RepID=UPI0035148320
MLLLGLLLLGATAAFTGLIIAYNLSGGPDYPVSLFGTTIASMTSLEIFLAGLALALIFCFAVALAGVGGRLASRRAALLRKARKGAAHAAEPVSTYARQPEPTSQPGPEKASSSPSLRRRRHLFGH